MTSLKVRESRLDYETSIHAEVIEHQLSETITCDQSVKEGSRNETTEAYPW